MMLGLSLSAFTTLHTIISLIGIATGLIVVFGMLSGNRMTGMTAIFLATTILTSVTGFMFPFNGVLPSHIFGVISIVVLAIATFALYSRQLAGAWRWIYIASAVFALYLNSFVGVVQSFQKIAPLKALAPTQAELPFVIAQGGLLVLFVVAGIAATRRFHPVVTRAMP